MPEVAQTNVQLLREVIGAGWSDDELVRLRSAYEMSMWAYSGQYRGSGQTQIEHHVAVASALVMTGERPALVIAGLMHTLYFFGEFGSGRRGGHAKERARVRAMFGDEIEELVYEYPQVKWSTASVAQMTAEAPGATSRRRDLVALRVANAVDDYADAGLRLAPRPTYPEDLTGDRAAGAIARLADAHGLTALAALLRDTAARADEVPVRDVTVTESVRVVLVPPASHRRRMHVVVQDNRLVHSITEAVPGVRRAGVWLRGKIA